MLSPTTTIISSPSCDIPNTTYTAVIASTTCIHIHQPTHMCGSLHHQSYLKHANAYSRVPGTPGDVFLLLKSSDFITHDLTAPFECCADPTDTSVGTAAAGPTATDESTAGAAAEAAAASLARTPTRGSAPVAPKVKYELVLRRWTDIATAMEFRCFVRRGRLVGVSQRDHTNFYPAIARDAAAIKRDVVDFYNKNVRGRFSRQSYTFDVCVGI
jgi:hypothetical protein